MKKITNDLYYVGVDDKRIDLFEGLYTVKNGISYNSYVIMDEKICVLNTIDQNFTDEWFKNIDEVLGTKNPDYLIVQHMEPDHSANILNFMNKYKNCTLVTSMIATNMLKNYFDTKFEDRLLIVKEGAELNLGKHILKFVETPMVHWPEVIMCYDTTDKTLFSSDAFGTFGAIGEKYDVCDFNTWIDEARRYYIGIVGRFGIKTTEALNKLTGLEVKTICSLHGPIIKGNIDKYINIYKTWASYKNEEKGILIAYTSVYGHTKIAAEKFYEMLQSEGIKTEIYDLARSDMYEVVSKAFKYDKLVLATTTYNAGIFPYMNEFLDKLLDRFIQNKKVGLIVNGSWAVTVDKAIIKKFEGASNITFANTMVKIQATLKESNIIEMKNLINELLL